MNKLLIASSLALLALGSSGAVAQDRAVAKTSSIAAPANVNASWGVETIAIDIRTADGPLWSGSLRLGGQYGNASFNQSKNEFAEPCPSKPSANATSNRQLNFSISRRNSPQNANQFYVNVNWTQPLSACQGEGSDSFGFNRVIEIAPGATVSITGAGGMVVKLTRQG